MKRAWSRRTFLASTAATGLSQVLAPALARAQGGLLSALADEPKGASAGPDAWKNAGVVDTSHSPYAKLRPVPVRAVVIEEGFWSKRRKTNLDASIPSMHDELVDHGRMNNFLRLEGKSSEPQ